MSLRMPIPKAIRDQLSDDPWMKDCIREGDGFCDGRIEWQHAFKYAGWRINELWSILPLCHYHHVHEASLRTEQDFWLRERIKYFGAREQFDSKYPKSDLFSQEPIVIVPKKRGRKPKDTTVATVPES